MDFLYETLFLILAALGAIVGVAWLLLQWQDFGMFRKKVFRWKEPKEHRRALSSAEMASVKWWHWPIAAVLVIGWIVFRQGHEWAPWLVLLAAAVGLLFVIGLLAFGFLFPSHILVFQDRFCRVRYGGGQWWKWADITGYEWRDCGDYDVLVLEKRQGTPVLVGVPRNVLRAELEQFFVACGLKEIREQKAGQAAMG